MISLPRKARIYIFLLTALMVGAVSLSFLNLGTNLTAWIPVAFVAVGIAVLDAVPIDLYGEQVEITLSNAVKFAAVLLYPPPIVVLGTFVGTLSGEIPAKRAWFKKLFNVSLLTLTWSLVAWAYQVVHQSNIDFFGSFQNIFALLVAGAIDFLFNSILVALVITITAKLPFRYVWSRNYREIIWHELSMIPLGAFLAVLWRFNPVSVVLAALPLLVVRHSYQVANDLQGQTNDALRALVRVIDERYHHTLDHSELVAKYAQQIAEALQLPQQDIDTITPAALLHDLGKVGMADDVLFNPKSLNPTERKHAQQHAEVGAMLLSKFPLFRKGANLVRYHHERYDGKGYPEGLVGEDIPLGSRIISVADAYQAMTEDRPYRRALSQGEAIAQLMQGSGTQFDPRVVQALVQSLSPQAEATPSPVVLPQSAEV